MKPDWDKLMQDFKGSTTVLVADVDCTAAGKSLCEKVGVKGYPTIKYGDPNKLEDYKGGRNLDALRAFAEENFGPSCDPASLDLCDQSQKENILKFQSMSSTELDAAIQEKQAEVDKQKADFKALVEEQDLARSDALKARAKMQAEGVALFKNSGLSLMKAVRAHAKKSSKSDEL